MFASPWPTWSGSYPPLQSFLTPHSIFFTAAPLTFILVLNQENHPCLRTFAHTTLPANDLSSDFYMFGSFLLWIAIQVSTPNRCPIKSDTFLSALCPVTITPPYLSFLLTVVTSSYPFTYLLASIFFISVLDRKPPWVQGYICLIYYSVLV